ncbi:hypothetical protein HQ560_13605 [bacterium]|nr:hypothetical protein [bacterium]
MDGWIQFWKIACIVGFSLFYIVVIAIIPLGGRDLLRLFRHLDRGAEDPAPDETE